MKTCIHGRSRILIKKPVSVLGVPLFLWEVKKSTYLENSKVPDTEFLQSFLRTQQHLLGVVACTCNPATLEAEFRNDVGSIPVGGNNPSIGGWIV